MKNILVVGSGGREHAIARTFAKSSHVQRVIVAPGNPGMVEGKITTHNIAVDEVEALVDFAKANTIDLTFVGPEQALVAGIVDRFREEGLAVVGPTQAAAQLESSKQFAKDVMASAHVATGRHQFFTPKEKSSALSLVEQLTPPIVVKEDALAAGKGVYILPNQTETQAVIDQQLTAGHSLLVEEFLEGEEFSHFSLVFGETVIPLTVARDYKRVYDGDKGPNTGGMGAFSPVPYVDCDLEKQVVEEIVRPVAKEMVKRGCPYTGILYTGLILTKEGPKVIEFNARFGDPETQVVLQRLEDDWVELLEEHLAGQEVTAHFSPEWTAGVVLAAEGYPGAYAKNFLVDVRQANPDNLYYAGLQAGEEEGCYRSSGGRILMATGRGDSLDQAVNQAYQTIRKVKADEAFYRKDIAKAYLATKEVVKAPKVAMVMGSQSDWEQMKPGAELLETLGIPYRKAVVSAHRMPDEMFDFANSAKEKGLEVIIAGAGGAAHLPGMIAAKTLLPVIGVPMKSSTLNGVDSLLSIVQMPAGVPVATVSIGPAGAKNAALLAARLLAVHDEALAERLEQWMKEQHDRAVESSDELD